MNKYFSYKTTHHESFKGHDIHCCHHKPDILCHVDGQKLGWYTSTPAAVNAAQKHIIKLIEDKDKS